MTGAGRARLLFTAIVASLVSVGLVLDRGANAAATSAGDTRASRDPVLPSWNDGAARSAVLSFVDREVASDRQSPFGRLSRGPDEAASRGWVVASMKRDWKAILPAPSAPR